MHDDFLVERSWTEEEVRTACAHIEEGHLQAARGEVMTAISPAGHPGDEGSLAQQALATSMAGRIRATASCNSPGQ